MMWILKQTNQNKTKEKYIGSKNYMKLINYIRKFDKVNKVNEYNYTAYDNDEQILFEIHLCDYLDYNPKSK